MCGLSVSTQAAGVRMRGQSVHHMQMAIELPSQTLAGGESRLTSLLWKKANRSPYPVLTVNRIDGEGTLAAVRETMKDRTDIAYRYSVQTCVCKE